MLVGVETHPNSMASPHAAYTGWDPRQATGSRLLGPHLPTPAQGGFRPYVRFRIGGDGTPSSHTYSAFPTPSRLRIAGGSQVLSTCPKGFGSPRPPIPATVSCKRAVYHAHASWHAAGHP